MDTQEVGGGGGKRKFNDDSQGFRGNGGPDKFRRHSEGRPAFNGNNRPQFNKGGNFNRGNRSFNGNNNNRSFNGNNNNRSFGDNKSPNNWNRGGNNYNNRQYQRGPKNFNQKSFGDEKNKSDFFQKSNKPWQQNKVNNDQNDKFAQQPNHKKFDEGNGEDNNENSVDMTLRIDNIIQQIDKKIGGNSDKSKKDDSKPEGNAFNASESEDDDDDDDSQLIKDIKTNLNSELAKKKSENGVQPKKTKFDASESEDDSDTEESIETPNESKNINENSDEESDTDNELSNSNISVEPKGLTNKIKMNESQSTDSDSEESVENTSQTKVNTKVSNKTNLDKKVKTKIQRTVQTVNGKNVPKFRNASEKKELLPRTIFIRNLPPELKTSQLEKFFARYGKVSNVSINKPKLVGHIVFESPTSAVSALEVNGIKYNNHYIQVFMRNHTDVDSNKIAYVKTVPKNVHFNDLWCAFELYGPIERISLSKNKSSNSSHAVVQFQCVDSAKQAISFGKLKVKDDEVEVTAFIPQKVASKSDKKSIGIDKSKKLSKHS